MASLGKKMLGQFYTVNYDKILNGLNIPDDTKIIVEPFCGNGDLIKFCESQRIPFIYEKYDIDPKMDDCEKTVTNWVLTCAMKVWYSLSESIS